MPHAFRMTTASYERDQLTHPPQTSTASPSEMQLWNLGAGAGCQAGTQQRGGQAGGGSPAPSLS